MTKPVLHLQAIAACSLNAVIGKDNGIPWHLPEDFAWFKEKTMGGTLVMGRKTYESIGRPLPGRRTVVLSRQADWSAKGVTVLARPSELEQLEPHGEFFLCGGAQLYAQLLPLCYDLFLTVVKRHVEGDAFLPEFEEYFVHREVLRSTPDFDILHFHNLRLPRKHPRQIRQYQLGPGFGVSPPTHGRLLNLPTLPEPL
ncbi:MAG: dihydrofolate reductase [Verrucomicrobiota bacterium]